MVSAADLLEKSRCSEWASCSYPHDQLAIGMPGWDLSVTVFHPAQMHVPWVGHIKVALSPTLDVLFWFIVSLWFSAFLSIASFLLMSAAERMRIRIFSSSAWL